MFAYILYHFGGNIKYLEYELYFISNLRNLTDYDIIYAYSVLDTPKKFIEIIKEMKLNIKFYKFNDDKITININENFSSLYKHFNTLRTCNFIFTYLLTQYKKICILESDMYIMKNIDDIFNLNTPSVHNSLYKKKIYNSEKDYESNSEIKVDESIDCKIGSSINGGILLIRPSKEKFNKYLDLIVQVIKSNCAFPNESLFLLMNKKYYNLPVKYNFTHFFIRVGYNKFDDIRLIHHNSTQYKLLDIVKEKYYFTKKDKSDLKYNIIIANKYYKYVYSKYKHKIIPLLNNIAN
jgi:alpha-N-acetylglucosamine transferase